MSSLRLIATLVVIYFLLLWVASIIWAYRDIRSRTTDMVAQAIGVAVVALMPLFGVALYLIVRPSETLAEAYERELEREAIRSELHALAPCPNCRRPVERDFVVCPYCRTVVREACVNCRKLLVPDWRHCPYCGTSRSVREPARAAYDDGGQGFGQGIEAPRRRPATASQQDEGQSPQPRPPRAPRRPQGPQE